MVHVLQQGQLLCRGSLQNVGRRRRLLRQVAACAGHPDVAKTDEHHVEQVANDGVGVEQQLLHPLAFDFNQHHILQGTRGDRARVLVYQCDSPIRSPAPTRASTQSLSGSEISTSPHSIRKAQSPASVY